jgi:hypothetical protein
MDQKLLNTAFFLVLTGFTWYYMLSPCDMIHLSQGIIPWLEHLPTSPVWNPASVACDYSWILMTWNLHIFLANLSFRKRKVKVWRVGEISHAIIDQKYSHRSIVVEKLVSNVSHLRFSLNICVEVFIHSLFLLYEIMMQNSMHFKKKDQHLLHIGTNFASNIWARRSWTFALRDLLQWCCLVGSPETFWPHIVCDNKESANYISHFLSV